jgi:diadenosine tetraphosphatase ApaH/serine/threonine PP2A family protein phosphatase
MHDQLRVILIVSPLMEDLMWSDPDDIDNWAVSPRGAGWLFGGSVTREVRVSYRNNSLWT